MLYNAPLHKQGRFCMHENGYISANCANLQYNKQVNFVRNNPAHTMHSIILLSSCRCMGER